MKISLAVTTCGEEPYTTKLLTYLEQFVENAKIQSPHEYEIVTVWDCRIDPNYVWPTVKQIEHLMVTKDFSAQKNFLNSQCTGDWILQLDADEAINDTFLFNIPALVESNPEVEAYWLPRVNTVHGLTLAHVAKWHWVLATLPEFTSGEMLDPTSEEYRLLKEYNYIISEENGVVTYQRPIVMWPDYQLRLYKNDPKIHWERPVHEQLVGYSNYTRFPADVNYAIEHHKEIKRQEAQNSLYETIAR